MPEPAPGTQQIVALAMVVSAVTLAVIAFLIYAGTIPMSEDIRLIAALLVGAAAFTDLLIGIWFFRKGQSS
jgi:hypothetical protein